MKKEGDVIVADIQGTTDSYNCCKFAKCYSLQFVIEHMVSLTDQSTCSGGAEHCQNGS